MKCVNYLYEYYFLTIWKPHIFMYNGWVHVQIFYLHLFHISFLTWLGENSLNEAKMNTGRSAVTSEYQVARFFFFAVFYLIQDFKNNRVLMNIFMKNFKVLDQVNQLNLFPGNRPRLCLLMGLWLFVVQIKKQWE